jgi:predicted lipoprotein
MKKVKIVTLFLLALAVVACNKKKDESDAEGAVDRSIILENYANYSIKPSFVELQTKINALQDTYTAFSSDKSLSNLNAMQNAWIEAYESWQYANAYNFGPAGEEGTRKGLIEEIGTFPVSEIKINDIITNNNANFNDFNRDARGFLAVEYLIFSTSDDNNSVLTAFASENRTNYLGALINHLKSNANRVVSEWDGYTQTFINNNGTSVGSSISLFYNEFVKSFESIKNFKVAIPLGLRPGQIQTEPTRSEAYYSGMSLRMMRAHFTAIKNSWYGIGRDNVQRQGLKSYLESEEGGAALVQSTITQLDVIQQKLDAIPNSPRFSAQIDSAPVPIDELHTELQKHTRFFKSDMSSILGISITFSSGDGD